MPKHYHHLTRDQRCQIYAFKASGMSQKRIALKLKVNPSTICRELKRNQGKRGYRYHQADKLSKERRHMASSRVKRMTTQMVQKIERHLLEDWSPQQISGRLRLKNIFISHERIYQYIWADKQLGGGLYQHLRHHGKKYNKRSSGKAGRGSIPNRKDIKDRPLIVEQKLRMGDWEGDTLIGKKHQGALLSYVERKSKYTILGKINKKTAKEVVQETAKRFSKISKASKTITYDNGKEFSLHEEITRLTGAQCYFATPYRSWERGLNEHTNGLIRQYFPKSADFRHITALDVRRVENLLNNRPRKVLGYLKPKEVLSKYLQSRIAAHT